MRLMKLLCLTVFSFATFSCKKERFDSINDNRSILYRTESVRQNDNLGGPPQYVTSTFQYDSLGRCIFQHIDSGNVNLVWSWSNNQLRVERFGNGSSTPDTYWTINLDNNGLMTDGNLWGLYETATYDANQQRTFTFFDFKDGYNKDSTYWYWKHGNIDSISSKRTGDVVWTPTKYTYYPGTTNTISPVYWGRTYEGANNLNLVATSSRFDWSANTWKTTSYTYVFDSLDRATIRVELRPNGYRDTTFYAYF